MMTKAQRYKFMVEVWPAVCKAQKWNKSDNERRYAFFAQVLGMVPRHARTLAQGGHISFNDFDNSDLDAILAECGRLTDNIKRTIETDHPELGDARRVHHQIDQELACLRVYVDNPTSYLVPILRAKFRGKTTIDELSPEPTLKDHGTIPSELTRCLYTLRTIVNKKRTEKGHSVHKMRLLANVPCSCAICVPRKQVVLYTENEPF
jgi:hypothetical protein